MPFFEYTAYDKKNNRKIKGEIDSTSAATVRDDLGAKGLFVIEVKEKVAKKQFKFKLPTFKSVPWKELAGFFKSLSLSVKAGVSLSQVFETLVDQAVHPYFKTVLADVHLGITKGRALSECFEAYPKIFPHQFIALVQGGEQSGKLAETLEEYSKYVEERRKMMGEIIGKLAYPAIIVLVAVAALLILTLHIFPTFMKALNIPISKLPFVTQLVYGFSTTVLEHWPTILVLVIVGGGGSQYFFFGTSQGRKIVHYLQINFPVVKELFKKMNIATFSRTMALQSKAGVASVASLELTKKSMPNLYYVEMVDDILETIKRGGSYLEAMKKKPHLVTPLVTLLISVGEQTGTFDEVLDTIATYYNDEVRATVSALTSMIEPLMIVLMGCFVAVIVSAMFLPLFDLVTLVH
ncbi:MAG: type II secretion system F family protein [Candidatus Wallbacteria bacterium]|nr:type II secretion system F family protein [Candidatus Wallbacteria bacterium]